MSRSCNSASPPPGIAELTFGEFQVAFKDFFGATVSKNDVDETFVPAMEKALVKSPEVALVTVASFFSSIDRASTTSFATISKLLPGLLAQAKSVTPTTRLASIHLFSILIADADPADLSTSAELVYAPLKGGKTSSPDHRTTLYSMLALLPASAALSPSLVTLTLTLLPKETNDVAVASMMRVLSVHLPVALEAGTSIPALQLAALVKGMQDPKPAIRRAVHATIGNVLWSLPKTEAGEAAQAFGAGILPGLESALKTVTSNPLNSPSGALEGYVAVAVLKGRLGLWGVKKIGSSFPAHLPRGFGH